VKVENKIRIRLVYNLRRRRSMFLEISRGIIMKILKAKTVEEIMELKRDLLKAYVDLMPMGVDCCYFCMLRGPNCDRCEYGRVHGFCPELGSDYSDLVNAREDLRKAIAKYYKGESY